MDPLKGNQESWFQTWWGVLLIGFIVLLAIAVLGLGSIVGYYVWKIKSGQGDNLAKQFNQSNVASSQISSIRKDLEDVDNPILGNPDANLVIVEFVDFKCPNCKAEDPIIRKIVQKYWKKVKVIIRNFPAESIHPGASELALLAACANEQGKYWALHDLFFSNQDSLPATLNETQVGNLLNQAGVDFVKVRQCLADNKVQVKVNRDYATGFKYGVAGTPTFFINGQKVAGVITAEAWDKFLGGL